MTLSKRMTEAEIKVIFKQMLKAIQYCHQHNIIHRDVKVENFLVKTIGNVLTVKLSDFGLACSYDPNDPPSQPCGSLYTVAPEVINR